MPVTFGPYTLLAKIGQGATGEVYRARHRILGREVALKILHGRWLTNRTVLRRFRREIRAGARLSHPNVVRVHDAGKAAGTYYFAMDHVAGIDLRTLVQQFGPLPPAWVCEIGRQIALGLHHLHEMGLVHRDLKPANVLVSPVPSRIELTRPPSSNLQVKIVDLSVSRRRESPVEGGLTDMGVFVGTPDFTSPEQARDARRVDPRSDLYSLGATLYYLLSGRAPFPGGRELDKLARHQGADRPEPLNRLRPDLPRSVTVVIAHLMAKRPEDRYQTPLEVASALANCLRSRATGFCEVR
jgi:eukaryotic-like serine/threonine-protein kinase